MSLLNNKLEKITFGIIVGNRDVFSDELAKQGRIEIIEVMNELGNDHIILGENDTRFGAVETYEDTKKCAQLFKENDRRILPS